MAKDIWLRGRCNQILRDRVDNYIKSQDAIGRTIGEADVVRDAVVEYLNREEGCPCAKHGVNLPQPESLLDDAANKVLAAHSVQAGQPSTSKPSTLQSAGKKSKRKHPASPKPDQK